MQNVIDMTDNELTNILETLIIRVHNYRNDTENCNVSEIALIFYFTKTFNNKCNYLSYFIGHKNEILGNLKIIYPQISENMSYMDHSKLFSILNYLILINKYRNNFLLKPFNYQLDIVFAITENNVPYTNFDNFVPVLLDEKVCEIYAKINNIFRKYTILEELLNIKGGSNTFNVNRAIKILKGYLIPMKQFAVDVEFNIDNLYSFFVEVQNVDHENNVNSLIEEYDFSKMLMIKSMSAQVITDFLSVARSIFSSIITNEEKAKLIIMLTNEFVEGKDNIIDFNQIKKG
jgi:hypothetical protein